MLGNFKKAIFRALCLCCALIGGGGLMEEPDPEADSYTHFRAHETVLNHVCRLLPQKKKHNTDKTRQRQ
ncbi:hypothetical protein JP0002_14230 [Helicobacter pylori]